MSRIRWALEREKAQLLEALEERRLEVEFLKGALEKVDARRRKKTGTL
jgi:hypothetical protein